MRPGIYSNIPKTKAGAEHWLNGPLPQSLGDKLRAIADYTDAATIGADSYGSSDWFAGAERTMARMLAQESALFFPTGAMAQQLALRLHCERAESERFAMHPTCQLEINEHHAYRYLHRLEAVLVGEPYECLRASDLAELNTDVAALVVELPMRQLGGLAPTFADLEALLDTARSACLRLHLDAARLLEVCPFYERDAAALAGMFDTVYLSCYKGLGGLGGAILAGSEETIEWMRPWRRRQGGEVKIMTPYLASAMQNLDEHLLRVGDWWQRAKAIAAMFNQQPGLSTRPLVPQCNMFHLDFAYTAETILAARDRVLEKTGVWLFDFVHEPGGDRLPMTEIPVQTAAMSLPDDRLSSAIRCFVDALTPTTCVTGGRGPGVSKNT